MRPKAPPIDAGSWLNPTPSTPLDGRLQGRVTALLFFSSFCEASSSRISELVEVRDRLPGLEVIGIHTPRYAHERSEDLVRSQLERHRIDFDVIHDPEAELWGRYNPGGWPSTMLIDGHGRAVGACRGLDDLEPLAEAAAFALARQGPTATPHRSPSAPIEIDERHPLLWPSGLCTFADGRVGVVDGADRALILRFDGNHRRALVDQIVAGLDRPSKIARWGENSIAMSLPTTGAVIGIDLDRPDPIVLAEELGRPQGLTTDLDGSVVVCDAGDDQLVRITEDGALGVIAGTGFTGLVDGPAAAAELAQPVAVTRTAHGLVFCDAGSNNLRLLTDKGRVHTVTDSSFTRMGLIDGPAHKAVLQRPTGVAALSDGSLIVADTGNHRLRLVSDERVKTLGVAGLNAPEGVTEVREGLVLVADTGNHRLVMVDLDDHQVWIPDVIGLSSPTA